LGPEHFKRRIQNLALGHFGFFIGGFRLRLRFEHVQIIAIGTAAVKEYSERVQNGDG
jgi:hypothetical protein